jgi:hypothetical protein
VNISSVSEAKGSPRSRIPEGSNLSGNEISDAEEAASSCGMFPSASTPLSVVGFSCDACGRAQEVRRKLMMQHKNSLISLLYRIL